MIDVVKSTGNQGFVSCSLFYSVKLIKFEGFLRETLLCKLPGLAFIIS